MHLRCVLKYLSNCQPFLLVHSTMKSKCLRMKSYQVHILVDLINSLPLNQHFWRLNSLAFSLRSSFIVTRTNACSKYRGKCGNKGLWKMDLEEMLEHIDVFCRTWSFGGCCFFLQNMITLWWLCTPASRNCGIDWAFQDRVWRHGTWKPFSIPCSIHSQFTSQKVSGRVNSIHKWPPNKHVLILGSAIQ